jgi:hypothetical protein
LVKRDAKRGGIAVLGCESGEAGPTEYSAALTGNPSACEASGTLKKR